MCMMTKEQIMEKIQEAEVVSWNDYCRAVAVQGEGSTIAYAMKHRHAAIRDLMDDIGIMKVDNVQRMLSNK